MNMIHLIFSIITIYTISCQSNVYNCMSDYKCVGDEINTINGNVTDIVGFGYHSISGKTTSIISNGVIHCGGAFACHEIAYINTSSSILCSGSNSCRNISGSSSFIETTTSKKSTTIYCKGSNSCYYSNLRITGSGIRCSGDQSCAYSDIQFKGIDKSFIYGSGAYSLIYSKLKSPGIGTSITIYLEGYNSGFGAKIICLSSDICNIYCYGNSCYMLYIECNGTCNILTDSTIYPITNITEFNQYLNLLYDNYNSETLTRNNDKQCNEQPNSRTYDSNGQSYLDIIITADNAGPICCRGRNSCRDSGKIEFNKTKTNATQDVIVCSGYIGCYGVGTINNNNNGAIFCEASLSCSYTNIITRNNIYCLSDEGCKHSNFKNAQNVFCSGYLSCYNVTITSFGGDSNIYLLGGEAGKNMQIYCNNNDDCFVLCGGNNACTTTTVYCYGNCTIQCEYGYQCPQIITINPTINPTYIPSIDPTQNPTPTGNKKEREIIIRDPNITSSDTSIKKKLNNNNNNNNNVYSLFIIMGVFIGFMIICLCIIIAYKYYRHKEKEKENVEIVEINPSVEMLRVTSDSNISPIPNKSTEHRVNHIINTDIIIDDQDNDDNYNNNPKTIGGDNIIVDDEDDNNPKTFGGDEIIRGSDDDDTPIGFGENDEQFPSDNDEQNVVINNNEDEDEIVIEGHNDKFGDMNTAGNM